MSSRGHTNPSSSSSAGASKQRRKQERAEKVAAMRAVEERRKRRRRVVVFGSAAAMSTLVIGLAGWGITQLPDAEKTTPLPELVSGEGTDLPPWPLPEDPVALAKKASLRVAPMEGTAEHFHTHLDVIVDGEPVTVPANIGIHPAGTAMSELHTHDERGVIHIEAPTDDKRYTLGQLFAEWDVKLDADTLGGLEADETNTLRAYVDGEPFDGDPARIELKPRGQIALIYGPKDADVEVPDDFDFKPGE
ncbi:hypothetical protein [Nocardiopsis rhodophaea]|uniref:hypothetical protein n=1 Tax=Nocardiopsis rhodophaea TaxID=280238 RepID=UPI0031CE4E8B